MTELPIDSFFLELSQGYNDIEIAEIKRYLTNWHKASYVSIAHNILDYSQRKRIDPVNYLH
ncbi:hypothetical protein [Geminocystis herdmanii]|uniref:hypothetical protein n=1 Tax=Geminocystis herdmanii TaxID=669359 RepID=UPI00034D76E7|nr:hypothetical protein [Geminocystis herdmanii]